MGPLSGGLSMGIELAMDSLAVRVLYLSRVDEVFIVDLFRRHGCEAGAVGEQKPLGNTPILKLSMLGKTEGVMNPVFRSRERGSYIDLRIGARRATRSPTLLTEQT